MCKGCSGGCDGLFLIVVSIGGIKDVCQFFVQCVGSLQVVCLVEEGMYLIGYVVKVGRCIKNNGVVIGQFLWGCNWCSLCFIVCFFK